MRLLYRFPVISRVLPGLFKGRLGKTIGPKDGPSAGRNAQVGRNARGPGAYGARSKRTHGGAVGRPKYGATTGQVIQHEA